MAATKPPQEISTCKAVASGSYGPTTWANVFWFLIGTTTHTPGVVIADVATAVHDFYATAIGLGFFNTSWHHQFTTVTYRDAADSLVRLRVADAQAGTEAANEQDAQVAYLINWATSDPRRGGKPRQYLSGVWDGAMQDPAQLTSSAQTTINATLLTWLAGLPSRSTPMQLIEESFRNGNTFRDTATHFPILGGTINPVVATQRRRVDRLRP